MAVLIVPEVLRPFSNAAELNLPIQTLGEFSAWLEKNEPRLHYVVFQQDPSGSNNHQNKTDHKTNKMNGFLNLYLENRAVTHQLTEAIPLSSTSSLRLITSVSGG
jgi:hypothetical protein